MSVTHITIAIFAIICVCIVVIYIGQARERARVEKVRKISALTERHRRMQCLLHELPPQYLTNELRAMIAERSIETLQELAGLKNDARTMENLEQDREFLKNIQENNPSFKPVKIRDENAGKEVRKLLQVLYTFIQTQNKRKLLDAASTKKYLSQIVFAASQSKADMFAARAEQAIKIEKPRVAIHNYHNAIAAFKDMANHPQAAQAITQYRRKIKELEQHADGQKQATRAASQSKLEASDEWSDFLKDDDDWKKKNTYDD